MRDLLFCILTFVFAIAALVAKGDHNDFMMVIALYCLTGYCLLGKEMSIKMHLGTAKFWMRIKLLLITTAYILFNYFALMKAINTMDIRAIIFSIILLLTSSGLLYFTYKELKNNMKFH